MTNDLKTVNHTVYLLQPLYHLTYQGFQAIALKEFLYLTATSLRHIFFLFRSLYNWGGIKSLPCL